MADLSFFLWGRCASEDVGLADPSAMPMAVAAFQGCQLIGKPECDVLLAHATVHLGKSRFWCLWCVASLKIFFSLHWIYSRIIRILVKCVESPAARAKKSHEVYNALSAVYQVIDKGTEWRTWFPVNLVIIRRTSTQYLWYLRIVFAGRSILDWIRMQPLRWMALDRLRILLNRILSTSSNIQYFL
jgi:hypothetical protein